MLTYLGCRLSKPAECSQMKESHWQSRGADPELSRMEHSSQNLPSLAGLTRLPTPKMLLQLPKLLRWLLLELPLVIPGIGQKTPSELNPNPPKAKQRLKRPALDPPNQNL